MGYSFKILLLILILVSCKNQSNPELNKRQLTTRTTKIKEVQKIEKLIPIPNDLKKLGAFDFFDSNEIIRIWRFPEGGAIFEELIEIKFLNRTISE